MRELFQRDVELFAQVAAEDARDLSGFQEAMAHLEAGHRQFDFGQYEAARAAYLCGIESLGAKGCAPNIRCSLEAELSLSLSDCHANLGDFDLALPATDEAIALLEASLPEQNATRRLLAAQERRAFYLSWMGRCDSAALEAESVVAALREHVVNGSDWLVDLARSLDHLAEILERGHRLHDALAAAEESTLLRRRLDDTGKTSPLPFLRSLVTLARLAGTLGQFERAIACCEEGEAALSRIGQAGIPLDLKAQFASSHGRNLMQMGRHEAGEVRLLAASETFRRMVVASPEASVFRDAYAEVMLDIGLMHQPDEPTVAHRWLLRAAAQKRRVARDDPHPYHLGSLAEALIRLGQAQLRMARTQAARANFDRAITLLEQVGPLPNEFPDLAPDLTRGLLTVWTDPAALALRFTRLARILARASDLADDAYQEAVQAPIAAFHRLWLERFIDNGDGAAIINLLSFAHGRRLAQLAHAELAARHRRGAASADESAFLDLRCKLRRLDLEQAEILSARTPSSVSPGADGQGIVPGPTGQIRISDPNSLHPRHALAQIGNTLNAERDRLYRDYITLRDRLVEVGRVPGADNGMECDLQSLRTRLEPDAASAIWCVPRAFGVDRPPCAILFSATSAVPEMKPLTGMDKAAEHFARLSASWHFGRSGTRLGARPAPSPRFPSADSEALEQALHAQMGQLWCTLNEYLARHGLKQLDMVTHAEAHNLPWLGFCPNGIQLRQFPSLHFYVRRKAQAPVPPPSPQHPLILEADEDDDPAFTLYHASLEVAAIRHIWKDAVIDAQDPGASQVREAAVLWIVGHGSTRLGHPLIGPEADDLPLAEIDLFSHGDRTVRMIYASTCYLGRTTDIEGEPVGLPSIAALRPDAPLAAGSIAPVDDLATALLALLFHHYWREERNPRAAFDLALHALRTGAWPPQAQETLQGLIETWLPHARAQAESHARIGRETVRKLYPQLDERARLLKQYRIRRQGREFLGMWDKDGDGPEQTKAWLRQRVVPAQADSRSSYWAWFG
jgi:tetratricopeptide (TPR) repeat protein